MISIGEFNLTPAITSIITTIIGIFIKIILSKYFDGKKWDYYSYIGMLVVILISLTVVLISYYYYLTLPIYNNLFAIAMFLFNCIALVFFALGTFLVIKRLENNFTIYIDNNKKVFVKKSLNKNFYNDMLLLENDIDLKNELKNDVHIIFKKLYKGEKFTYYSKEGNSFTEVNFTYYKNSFKRLKLLSLKKLRCFSIMIILILTINIGLLTLNFLSNNNETLTIITAFTLLIINFIGSIVFIIISVRMTVDILEDNIKKQLKIVEFINKKIK